MTPPLEQVRSSLEGLADVFKSQAVAGLETAPIVSVASLQDDEEAIKFYVPILKSDSEKQEITGVVLTPEVVDAQGDIISADVIEKAAGDFLASYNRSTKLGFMHKEFNRRFELRQSFIAPSDMSIGSRVVKAGTWLMVVKVLEDKIWQAIKSGKLTGFSIGGKAKVKKLDEE
jgi:hypothetical protein